jgi:hypothetical protein
VGRRADPGVVLVTQRGNSWTTSCPTAPTRPKSARAIYVTAIGETSSRREATLIDLHQLHQKLERRRKRGDVVAAVLLLQQHLVDFRYTSPWVFLELRELYKELEPATGMGGGARSLSCPVRTERTACGRRRPRPTRNCWTTATCARALPASGPTGPRACGSCAGCWASTTCARAMGPPLLPLGVYRDLMLLDDVLDDAMPSAQPAPAPTADARAASSPAHPEPALSPT